MMPSQQWDTKPRAWLKETQATGECEETGSGKIPSADPINKDWQLPQNMVFERQLKFSLGEKQNKKSVLKYLVAYFSRQNLVMLMKWRACSTEDTWRGLTKAGGAHFWWCVHFHLPIVLGNHRPAFHRYFSAKRCKWTFNESFKSSNFSSVVC